MRYEQVIDLLTEAGEARNLANSAGHTQAASDLRRYAAELEHHAERLRWERAHRSERLH